MAAKGERGSRFHLARRHRSECLKGRVRRVEYLLGPRLPAPELVMAREYVARGRDNPDALILVLLSLHGAEQFTARVFGPTHLVQIDGDGHEAGRDALNDRLI